MGIVPMSSGVGRLTEPAAPAACWTRYLPFAGMLPVSLVSWKTTPAAEAYWTLQPETSMGLPVVLASSM